MPSVEDVLKLFEIHGGSQYGRESVTQREHALQAATLAETEQASPGLITAALLHDIGHLLHELPADAPDRGVDDHHESAGGHYLRQMFPDRVTEPVRLHVPAKRYLCTVDAGYFQTLSEPSVVSLKLQGGPMTPEEVDEFEAHRFAEDAVRLRRWDDAAKDPTASPRPLSHFVIYLHQVAKTGLDS